MVHGVNRPAEILHTVFGYLGAHTTGEIAKLPELPDKSVAIRIQLGIIDNMIENFKE